MPGMDGTGPQGKGPKSGWGAGRCLPPQKEQGDDALDAAPADEDDDPQPGWRRFFRWRRRNRGGGGRGRGRGQGMRGSDAE
jgi:hypothetical protein